MYICLLKEIYKIYNFLQALDTFPFAVSSADLINHVSVFSWFLKDFSLFSLWFQSSLRPSVSLLSVWGSFSLSTSGTRRLMMKSASVRDVLRFPLSSALGSWLPFCTIVTRVLMWCTSSWLKDWIQNHMPVLLLAQTDWKLLVIMMLAWQTTLFSIFSSSCSSYFFFFHLKICISVFRGGCNFSPRAMQFGRIIDPIYGEDRNYGCHGATLQIEKHPSNHLSLLSNRLATTEQPAGITSQHPRNIITATKQHPSNQLG